jgi:hypothetical protein
MEGVVRLMKQRGRKTNPAVDGMTMDVYNTDIARKAVGSLFDDEEELELPERPYRTFPEDDYEMPESKKTVRVPMPAPRPAVKVNVPPPARINNTRHRPEPEAPELPRRRPAGRYVFAEQEDGEDEFTMFRPRVNREKPDYTTQREEIEVESVGRTERPMRRTSETARVPVVSGATATEIDYSDDYEEEMEHDGPSMPARVIVVSVTVLFLVLMIFLVWRTNYLQGQLDAATENATDAEELSLALDYANFQLSLTNGELVSLRARVAELEAANVPDITYAPDYSYYGHYPEYPSNGTSAVSPFPTTHIIQSGDNLTRISQHFYGMGDYRAGIQRIMTANNITDANTLRVGQPLIIPAP